MDFAFSEAQDAIATLADQILGDHTTPERLKQIESGDEWFDRETWRLLAEAGLIGTACKVDVGGNGLGLLELAALHEVLGRYTAPLPILPTTLAAHTIDSFGTNDQRLGLVPPVLLGDRILTVGIQEPLDDNLLEPRLDAQPVDRGWSITGTKSNVEFWDHAAAILVTATTAHGPALFIVDARAPGISSSAGASTNRQPVHELRFTHTPAEALGPIGETGGSVNPVQWMVERAMALICVVQAGVVDRALRLAVSYTSEREQFGRPIATFQAVTQRLADQYIHANGVRLTAYSAIWALADEGDASEAVRNAKWFASDWAHEVAHATQHVHGGVGVDVDYPLHRYTLWNKHLESSLGAGTAQLRARGALLAAD